MNALANSRGGVCLLGIHNIYPRGNHTFSFKGSIPIWIHNIFCLWKVKGISIKEIAEHSFIQEIRKHSFANRPPIHFDINLLKVESISENDKSKDKFVIKIHVFPRKSNVVYAFDKR